MQGVKKYSGLLQLPPLEAKLSPVGLGLAPDRAWLEPAGCGGRLTRFFGSLAAAYHEGGIMKVLVSPIKIISRAAFLAVVFAQSAYASSAPILNFNPVEVGYDESHLDEMVGWSFGLQQALTITQVGWYDDGQDGLSRDIQVGLWGAGSQLLGDPIDGMIIRGGIEASLNGVWRVEDLSTPLDLQPGGYILAGLDSVQSSDVIKFVGMESQDNPTITGSRLTIGSPVWGGNYGPPGFYAPNTFLLVYGVELGPMLFFSVPEPSTGLLVLTGLLGLAARRRWCA